MKKLKERKLANRSGYQLIVKMSTVERDELDWVVNHLRVTRSALVRSLLGAVYRRQKNGVKKERGR